MKRTSFVKNLVDFLTFCHNKLCTSGTSEKKSEAYSFNNLKIWPIMITVLLNNSSFNFRKNATEIKFNMTIALFHKRFLKHSSLKTWVSSKHRHRPALISWKISL